MSPDLHPVGYDHSLRKALRGVLLAAVKAGPGAAGGIGSIECQVVATLYVLLVRDHPIDRWGRCRSCRRPGAVLGPRWRRCRVYSQAIVWLRQPEELLLRLLAEELGLATAPTEPLQTPVIPSPLPRLLVDPVERDGRIQITAGPEMIPDGLWSRRVPFEDLLSGSVRSPLLTGGIPGTS